MEEKEINYNLNLTKQDGSIIALSIENKQLKLQIEYLRAVIQSDHNMKH
jgi:hypothetical protein